MLKNTSPSVHQQLQRNVDNPDVLSLGIDTQRTVALATGLATIALLHAVADGTGNMEATAAPKTEIAATHEGSQPKQETGRYLKSVEELPGYSMRVTREQRKSVKNSAIKILRKPKPDTESIDMMEYTWQEVCTGNIVTVPGYNGSEILATTANHCLDTKSNRNGADYDFGKLPAVDVLPNSTYEWAIADASEDNSNFKTRTIIGTVNGISADQRGTDIALLKIQPNDERPEGSTARMLREIPPLKLQTVSRRKKQPLIGQEVAIASAPAASENRLITTKGRFLGFDRFYSENGQSRRIALVGIDPYSPEKDNCNFGASGSSAVTADGTTLGPLSIRIGLGYDNGDVQYDDQFFIDQDGQWKALNTGRRWADLQNTLGIDLSENFPVICGFSMPRTNGNPKDQNHYRKLLRGFNHIAPQVAPDPILADDQHMK